MIAIIGSPPEGQFRQIASAEDQAAVLIGQIHQDLGTFPSLTIFIGHVQFLRVLADIREVLGYRGGDVHLAKRGAVSLGQALGVAFGTAGGAKAGHGYRQNIASWAAQLFHSPHRYQQCEGGVQPAGQTDYRRFRMGMCQTPGQAGCLHGEDFLAAFPAVIGGGGDKRIRMDRASQLGGRQAQREGDFLIFLIFGRRKTGHPAPFKG